MVRRLRIQNKTDGRGKFRPPMREAFEPATSDGFSLKFAGGKGLLTLSGEVISDGVTLEALELVIENISFPFDISRGIRGLANRRHKLQRLQLGISLDAVLQHVQRRLAGNDWMHEVEVAFCSDYIGVSLLYGPRDTAVPLSFRLYPVEWPTGVALIIDDICCYGAMPGSLLSIAMVCMAQLSGFTIDGAFAVPDNPVYHSLINALPPKGWRLPSYQDVQLRQFSLQPRKCAVLFGDSTVVADAEVAGSGQGQDTGVKMLWLKRLEELRTMRSADAFLARGEPAEARRMIVSMLERTPKSPSLLIRLAMLDMPNPAMREKQMAQLQELLADGPTRRDALAVLLHGAALSGDVQLEVEMQKQLFADASPFEKLLGAMRIAEVMGEAHPLVAIPFLEQAVSVRRDHPDALLALMELYGHSRQISKLQALIPRWIAIHTASETQLFALLEAGRILTSVGQWQEAIDLYGRALELQPGSEDAAWGLANALAGNGEVERAIAAYTRLADKCRLRKDVDAEAAALGAIGEIWVREGEYGLAVQRLQESIDVQPTSAVRLLLAGALVSLDRLDQGVLQYQEALESAPVQDGEWGKSALQLAELFLTRLDDGDAARHWIELAARIEETRADAEALRLQVLHRQQKWQELAGMLEKNLVREGANASLDTLAQLAHARVAAGELTAAIATLESALAQHPDHEELLDAYIVALRRQGSSHKLIEALQKRVLQLAVGVRRVDFLVELGDLNLFSQNDPVAALRWYRAALEEDPGRLKAQEGLVEALSKLDDMAAYESGLHRLLDLHTRRKDTTKAASVLYALGEVRLKAGDGKGAAMMFEKALPDLSAEKKDDALQQMAAVFLEAGEYALAKELFGNLRKTKKFADDYGAALGEAEAAMYLKDYQCAYDAAVAAGSGPSELRAKSVRILVEASVHIGRAKEALGILRRVADNLDESEGIALLEFAATLAAEKLNDVALAMELYEAILSIAPGNDRAKNRLLQLLEQGGHRAELARKLVRFFGGDPNGVTEVKRAADFFLADGLFEEAVNALRDAYALCPDVESARMLAKALSRSGRDAEALSVLGEIAAVDDHARDVLLEHYDARGDVEAMLSLLAQSRSRDKNRECKRLSKMAELTLKTGDELKAAGFYLDAAGMADSEEAVRALLEPVMKIAISAQHPKLYARAVDSMKQVADEQERAAQKLVLAVMYFQAGMTEESALLLETGDFLRLLPLGDLVSTAQRNPSMEPLLVQVLRYAEEQQAFGDADHLLTLLIAGGSGTSRYEWLRQRAELREILSAPAKAVDDWLDLFDAGKLDESQTRHLIGLLEGLERKADLLHVMLGVVKTAEGNTPMLVNAAKLAGELHQRSLQKQLLRQSLRQKESADEPADSSADEAVTLFSLLNLPDDREEMRQLLKRVAVNAARLDDTHLRAFYELMLETHETPGSDGWVAAMMQLVRLAPLEPEHLRRLKKVLSQAGKWQLLAECLENWLALDIPAETAAAGWMELGELFMGKLDDEARGLGCFRRSLELSGTNLQALTLLGERAFAARDWHTLKELLQLAKDMGWHPMVTFWRAVMAEAEGNGAGAFMLFGELVDKAPQTEGAYEGFLRTVPDEGYESGIRDALAVVGRKRGYGQMSAAVHRKAARAYWSSQELDKSRRHLEIALSMEPLDVSSLLLLSRIYQTTGQSSARAYTLEKIAGLSGGDEQIGYLVEAARVFLDELHDVSRAAALLGRASVISSSEPDVLLGLADCAWAIEDYPRFTANLERLRLVAPHLVLDPIRMFRFAVALSRTGEWPLADIIELLERTIPDLDAQMRPEAAHLCETLQHELKTRKGR